MHKSHCLLILKILATTLVIWQKLIDNHTAWFLSYYLTLMACTNLARRPVVYHTCFNTDLGLRLRQHSNHTAYNIRDNSIVRLAALGTLFCTTPYQHCCQNRGQWRYPNETVVPTSQARTLFFTSRTDQGVLGLQRRTSFNHESADGVYECQIPDVNGRTRNLYTWIYSGSLCKLPALAFSCIYG